MVDPSPDQPVTNRLALAMQLAEAGYHLAPVIIHRDRVTGKKAPDYLWEGPGSGWHDRSSCDPEVIRDWWVAYGEHMSFLVDTGRSGLFGVDLDTTGSMSDPDGWACWAAAGMPVSAMLVDTPSGGAHLYWRTTPGETLTVHKRLHGMPIDVRADGGHLFAPGSVVIDPDGHIEPAGYVVRGPVVPVGELEELPSEVAEFLHAQRGERERVGERAQGERHDRAWVIAECRRQLDRVAAAPARTEAGFRSALMGAAMVLGRAVTANIIPRERAEKALRTSVLTVWGQVDDEDHRWIRDGLDAGEADPWTVTHGPPQLVSDAPQPSRGFTNGPPVHESTNAQVSDQSKINSRKSSTESDETSDDPLADPASASWTPLDLTPFLDGTYTAPTPSVGMARSDGLRFLYPGAEHTVIGQTEAGKSWWALAHVAAELDAGRDVVYVHYEEQSPADTVDRLMRFYRVPAEQIRRHFRFIAPLRPIHAGDMAAIGETLPSGRPVLVVNDGVNEALALIGQRPNDVDGIAVYRQRLVLPWTHTGAAVLNTDHVGKDGEAERTGVPINSIHKINGLSGAGFLLRSVDPFGRGRKGAAHLSVRKDRYGHLKAAGVPDQDGGPLFYMGTLVIDASDMDDWSLKLHAPKVDTELTEDHPAAQDFRDSKERRRASAVDERVFLAASEIIRSGKQPSKRMVLSAIGGNQGDVFAALDRLELAGRLDNQGVGRTTAYGFPGGVDPSTGEPLGTAQSRERARTFRTPAGDSGHGFRNG